MFCKAQEVHCTVFAATTEYAAITEYALPGVAETCGGGLLTLM